MDLHNPYQAPGASLDIPTAERPELAPRSTRLYAALIDRLLTNAGPVIGLITGTSVAMANGQFSLTNGLPMLLPLTVGLIDLILIYKSGQTIGKWLFSIKIVRSSGERCGLRRYFFLRAMALGIIVVLVNFALSHHFGYPPASAIVLFTFPLLSRCTADVLDAAFIFRPSRKCLHDNIADTKVVLV